MTDTSTTRQVDDFLRALDRALRGLSRTRRRETVLEIRAHIGAALVDAERTGLARPAAVDQVLSRLGSPAEIAAAAASEEPPVIRRGPGVRDTITAVLLLIGGVVVPLIGWFVGFVLLWTSQTFRVRDKLIGTLLVPGGLLPAVFLTLFVGSSGQPSGCTSTVRLTPGGGASRAVEHCTSSGGGTPIVGITVLVICVLGPLFTFGWLLFQAGRARRPDGVGVGD